MLTVQPRFRVQNADAMKDLIAQTNAEPGQATLRVVESSDGKGISLIMDDQAGNLVCWFYFSPQGASVLARMLFGTAKEVHERQSEAKGGAPR